MNPDAPGMTFGRLVTMADGRNELLWSHTAAIVAELMNGPRQRKDKQPWLPRHFDPYAGDNTEVVQVSTEEFMEHLRTALT